MRRKLPIQPREKEVGPERFKFVNEKNLHEEEKNFF